MSEFRPGDVWRRETKADTELLVLRKDLGGGVWKVVALSIGRVSGYAASIETTTNEERLVEEWTPLVPDPEFHLRRAARACRRVVERFTEECDPWMTPRKDPNDLGGLVPEAGDDG